LASMVAVNEKEKKKEREWLRSKLTNIMFEKNSRI
jgi:hypothetical protein